MNSPGLIQSYRENGKYKSQKCDKPIRGQYSDSRVLLGNWFDERSRQEAETDIMSHNLSRNELSSQKLDNYLNSVSRPLQLTRNLDGFLHHGDLVRLKWRFGVEPFYLAALPFSIGKDGSFSEPCLVTATRDSRIMARSAVFVFRNKNTVPNHVPLMYGECLVICTGDGTGNRLLECEPKTFSTFARKSGHQEVKFVKELSGRCLWKVLQEKKVVGRGQTEEKFVPSNTDLIVCHVATGQNLAFEKDTKMNTVMGKEKEVAVHSYVDRNKLPKEYNLWQFEAPLVTPEDYGNPIRLPREGYE